MDINEENPDSLWIDVVIPEDGKTAPCCPHGPTLLFAKTCKGKDEGRRFYACSACRDRKDCNFFQWEDDKVSEARLQAREAQNQSKRPRFTQSELCSRLQKFSSLPPDKKRFCQDCQVLLLPAEHAAHTAHSTAALTPAQLRRPSVLLTPLDNKKSNAQYLFTDRSAGFLLDTLAALGFTKVLCVGTPRLQELIKLRNLDRNHQPMRSLLLDIDYRYAQFYSPEEFCHYNMFNNHFFAGESSVAVLDHFLTEQDGEKVVLVADPPFGGLVKPLANTFSLISQRWRKLQSPGGDADMPTMWIFPYFFEPRILECLPSFTMLDYQVDYDNHPLYKHGKTGRKQSPVRLFTNMAARDIVLPGDEGYRFCAACDRYVCSLNKHCAKCDLCPSKDGREWKHCSSCSRCVKPSWRHCGSCGRCALPDHPCGPAGAPQGCFTCGSLKHKRRGCPLMKHHTSPGPKSKHAGRNASPHPLKMKNKRKSGAARRAKRASAPAV
ncbi:rRNA N6-adenosine-methyltransferase ZCCHC4 [Cololabis saira]|uniref:rRNA N6-adenosine-methyltransferase ZCCHC4 n=1 Tax=Cololabis saira TaxID=129043 RepID=UPI002AD3E1A5|nr:rRNA N6-adenosine-methyltransferase ZCCHC4 [Cololabis saira]XP_061565865.1 rRNA N6-adenosine-methyltransferase ZCCHC4 [Cololabis saira]XP_061565866.1 rRNA N6-adenosine-methyltransferase ZCCHC4 [Cololabis saira]